MSPFSAVKDLLVFAWNPNHAVESAKLNDQFAYVRVEHNNRLSLLALAYVESMNAGSPQQVYVSGSNETLTLQNGVITVFSTDAWHWEMYNGRVVSRPDYALVTAPAKPSGTKPPQSIQGMVISSASTDVIPLVWQPIAGGWAAFDFQNTKEGPWRFTYQCLKRDFCLAVQTWSAQMQKIKQAAN